MRGADAIFIGFIISLLAVVGPICGIIALLKVRDLGRRIRSLEHQLRSAPATVGSGQPASSPQPTPPAGAEPLAPCETPAPSPRPAPVAEMPPEPRVAAGGEDLLPPPPADSRLSLEVRLGTRWLNWVGIVMTLIGVGFFLKYAYDNAWIGPQGRLAIGALLGLVALGLGERFRRRDWSILFQVLTGGGIAAFYLCVFFSFQVYHLSDQTLSMVLAILVTALAVVMAVAHDAVPIGILAIVGGFLSPVLLSTGTNHPYALFTYIAILDLVAMGAAYFRRWRALDLLCFLGTAVIYQGWYDKFYGPDQMTPALLYVSIFYLMFLLIPTLHGLVRRLPETREGLALIALNAAVSFLFYYNVLFREYRYVLGFVVLGQALLVLALFQVWLKRVGRDTDTSASLLTIALALVTIAIPIQLKLYGIPIAWSVEGALLIFLGIRFRQTICKIAGVVALLLAAGGLATRLPLHREVFIPVVNVPFGSWAFVIAMGVASAILLARDEEGAEPWHPRLTGASSLLAFALTCALLHLEVSCFWTVNHPVQNFRTYETSSLIVLWSLIAGLAATLLDRRGLPEWMPLPWVCFGIGALVLFESLGSYGLPSPWLAANATFAPRALFVLALWWSARLARKNGLQFAADVLTVAGHAVLALLLAFELERWGRHSQFVTPKMGKSLISAAWALQAFTVIWLGLVRRSRLLRYLGFVLFLLAVAKTVFLDTSELEKVYRIVSFAACGVLLVAAGYFYQRYSAILLQEPEGEQRE
ncbi:MAG TPA: DUF2339 domain-containing protein [Syntrophobacteria bacterium]|nr:DUF2339 domain-containing protein [Syntrophobacteria bacterium]